MRYPFSRSALYYYLARARMSPSPDPVEAVVSLSGHVQEIYWTNFIDFCYTVSCYDLVVPF